MSRLEGPRAARAAWLVSADILPYGLCPLMFGALADRYGKITVCSYALAAFGVAAALHRRRVVVRNIVTLRTLTNPARERAARQTS